MAGEMYSQVSDPMHYCTKLATTVCIVVTLCSAVFSPKDQSDCASIIHHYYVQYIQYVHFVIGNCQGV